MSSVTGSTDYSSDFEDEGIIKKFHFSNGDTYYGDFCVKNKNFVMKKGHGIYKTKSKEEYETIWNNDKFGETVKIRFRDATIYEGEITPLGSLQGSGKFIFPDASFVQAEWTSGKIEDDINFVDANKSVWKGKHLQNEKKIIFSPPNLFWDNIQTDKRSKESSIEHEISSLESQEDSQKAFKKE